MKINILGTEYEIVTNATVEDYPALEGRDGYCDWSSKMIVIKEDDEQNDYDNFEVVTNEIIRHEIVHAFLNESGLQFESQNEQMVDWMALQIPKMAKVFKEHQWM